MREPTPEEWLGTYEGSPLSEMSMELWPVTGWLIGAQRLRCPKSRFGAAGFGLAKLVKGLELGGNVRWRTIFAS